MHAIIPSHAKKCHVLLKPTQLTFYSINIAYVHISFGSLTCFHNGGANFLKNICEICDPL